MIGLLVRVRVFAGQLALLAVLGLVAALLVTGAPRIANELADRALRQDIAAEPYNTRDIILQQNPGTGQIDVVRAAGALDSYRQILAQPLPGLVGGQWFAARVGPEDVTTLAPSGPRTAFGLRTQPGTQELTRLTAGRWPATRPDAPRVEIAASSEVAALMGLKVNTALAVGVVKALVVGVFEPVDRSAPAWDDMPQVLTPAQGLGDEVLPTAVVLTDPVGLATAARGLDQLTYTWRYRVDERRLDTGMLDAVTTAAVRTRQAPPAEKTSVLTSLGSVLARFDGQLRSVRALLAVVQAGLLATLLGLVVLAAELAVERRRQEFALLRARGGAIATIGGRTLAEALVALTPAVAAGWLLGQRVPGRPAGTGWLVLVVGAAAVLAMPVLAMAGQRRVSFVARRRDLAGGRPSARRLTAELSVLVLAVLGAYLLRRRGLSPDGGVDPYLACVPVLLATGTALIALRIVPWPLRQAGRFAGRARGAVAFLGLARAGRAEAATVGPLAVLVVAITTGVFCAVVTSTIDDARDRASAQEIPADARLTGFRFTPETADRLAAVPGVKAVAPVADFPGTPISAARGSAGFAEVVLVNVDTFRKVVDAAVPPALAGSAVVSPEVAADVGSAGVAEARTGPVGFTVGAVVSRFPGLDSSIRRFVILPWPAGIAPNQFLVAGHGFDPAALRTVGDEGQRAYAGKAVDNPTGLAQPTQVTTRAEHREALERTGANEVLTFAFVTGTVGAAVLALLAIGFTVLAEARPRGRAVSRLRTMGLSARQSRGLLVYELVPLVAIAILAGGLVGVLLPRVLGPTLGLATFTAGEPARTYLDPLLVGGLLALVVFALATGVLVENMANRRLRLGEVLRLGEDR